MRQVDAIDRAMRGVLDDVHASFGQPLIEFQPLRADEGRSPSGRDAPTHTIVGSLGQRHRMGLEENRVFDQL